jgi:hypothetical protein
MVQGQTQAKNVRPSPKNKAKMGCSMPQVVKWLPSKYNVLHFDLSTKEGKYFRKIHFKTA